MERHEKPPRYSHCDRPDYGGICCFQDFLGAHRNGILTHDKWQRFPIIRLVFQIGKPATVAGIWITQAWRAGCSDSVAC
jgi:hypothetical protein